MWFAAFKAALSGLLVASISETARRSPAMGALIASLPVVSVLGMIWLWQDTHDSEKIASHAEATFWLVLLVIVRAPYAPQQVGEPGW